MKTPTEILQFDVGGMVLQSAQLRSELSAAQERTDRSYELLAQCIRSGQLDAAQVEAVLMADEVFRAWYARKYPERQ